MAEDLRRAINADNIRAALCIIKHVDDCRVTSRIVEANQDMLVKVSCCAGGAMAPNRFRSSCVSSTCNTGLC